MTLGDGQTRFIGLVISHLGQGIAVESQDGAIHICQTRRQLGDIAVGDQVTWSQEPNQQGRIEQVHPRTSILSRPAHAGKTRIVAANLSQVVVVIAPEPEPDWLLVDQYLAVCEFSGLGAVLVLNKSDLSSGNASIEKEISAYKNIGYECLKMSARTQLGIQELKDRLNNNSSMLSGQSGVGKSSLTNALLPEKQLRTREISKKAGLGRHTTTAATLYHLSNGGHFIDSPGVSVFGLAGMNLQDLAYGYREIRQFGPSCQFNDCRHVQDKGCAVRQALERGQIAESRYNRYLKLSSKMHLRD